jgi:hypothetical protein
VAQGEGRAPGRPELPKAGMLVDPKAGASNAGVEFGADDVGPNVRVELGAEVVEPNADVELGAEGVDPNAEDPNIAPLLGAALDVEGVPHGDCF